MKFIKFMTLIALSASVLACPGFAQSSDDEEFVGTQVVNAIDYYSSRMIKGIGFQFYQYYEEKIDGRRETEIYPQLYLNIHPGFALKIGNRTLSKNIVGTEKLSFSTPPISSLTNIEAQIRPFSNIQLFPFIRVAKSKHAYDSQLESTIHFQDENREYNLGLYGLYVSGGGTTTPVEWQLEQSFFTDGFMPMMQERQWMLSFSGSVKFIDFDGLSEKKTKYDSEPNYIKNFDTHRQEYELIIDAHYGLSSNAVIGLCSTIDMFENKLSLTEGGVQNYDSQNLYRIRTGPELYFRFSDNVFNCFSVDVSSIRVREEFESQKQNNVSIWEGQYSLFWLADSRKISTKKVLANHNGFFGNRLSRGGRLFYISAARQADFLLNTLDRVIQDRGLLDIYRQELQSSSFTCDAGIKYGISNYAEIGIASVWRQDRSFIPHPGESALAWFDKSSWTNKISFQFANYVYSDDLEKVFGWNSLSQFDIYDGRQILHPLMLMGRFSAALFTLEQADEYFKYINHNNPLLWSSMTPYVINKKWQISEEFALGLWKNFEISHKGQYIIYSSEVRNYLDKDWQFDFILSWQFYKSLRLQVCQRSLKYVNNWDTRFSYYLDPYYSVTSFDAKLYNKTINTWIVQLSSLF